MLQQRTAAACARLTSRPRIAAPARLQQQRRTQPIVAASEEPGSSTPPQQQQQTGPVVREYKAWGMRVIESNEPLPGPEAEKDFWEGDQFQAFGQAMEKYFLPGLLVLGVVCGGIAAQTYNQGADVFMTSATEDNLPQMIPADQVVAPPVK